MNAINQFLPLLFAQHTGLPLSSMNLPGTLLAVTGKLFWSAPIGVAALGFLATLFFSGFDTHDVDDD